MIISTNDQLYNKKIKCSANLGNVLHEITLPIATLHNYNNKSSFIPLTTNNFIFEDLEFKSLIVKKTTEPTQSQSLDNYNNLNLNFNNMGDLNAALLRNFLGGN